MSASVGSVRLGAVASTHGESGHRVSAPLGDAPVWFESHDAVLDDGAESFAGAALLPVLAGDRHLVIDGAVSATWLANIEQAMVIWHEWWGYPILAPSPSSLTEPRARSAGTALCFTGGVDSFHTLLTAPVKPEVLVFVHGFNVRRDNHALADQCAATMRDVAADVGARSVLMRTNLWEHPLFVSAKLIHVMGGSFAAVGHLLADQVGSLVISSGFSRTQPVAAKDRLGTHWELDPLMSSDRLEVVHYGDDATRIDKVRAIADYEVVHRHLRVCNRGGLTNCSQCDKCLLTMATICAVGGDPTRFVGFDWREPMVDRLGRLRVTKYLRTYAGVAELDIDPAMAAAIVALLDRTRAQPSFARRMVRRARRLRR